MVLMQVLYTHSDTAKLNELGSEFGLGKPLENVGVDLHPPTTKFGFHIPTCCGYIVQNNEWEEDWTVCLGIAQ